MMDDERPIKPDRKYLQEYVERMSKPEPKGFLKKKSQPVLPCYIHNNDKQAIRNQQQKEKKTKAEIYEEIKRKNKIRFGQKHIEVAEEVVPKKINVKKMTVYKSPATKPKISTDEYKLNKQKAVKPNNKKQEKNTDKVEYDKLLDYFKKELTEFQKQKQQFNQIAGKLKFKENISQYEGLSYSKVKSQVQRKLITQTFSEKGSNNQNGVNLKGEGSQLRQLKTVRQFGDDSLIPKVKNLSKTYSIVQIRNCMDETNQKLSELKQQLLNRDIYIQEHKYDISQINILPQFNPQTLYQYIDHPKLQYNQNDLYIKALKAFNSKFEKENIGQNNIRQNEEQGQRKMKMEIKVKFIGEKRVMKYDGWTQVWIPGRQRLMTNGEGEKVIWLSNGDVLQEYPGKIKTYYSKSKQLLKIQFKEFPPIYYHHAMSQLWWLTDQKTRETVFSNGRRQITPEQNDKL